MESYATASEATRNDTAGPEAKCAQQLTVEESAVPAAPASEASTIASSEQDGKPRSSIDERALETIAVPRDTVGQGVAQAWVAADLTAYRAIQTPAEQIEAAHTMGYNAVQQVSYRLELERQDPAIASTAMRTYMDEAARLVRGAQLDRGWQDLEVAGMHDRHASVASIGLARLPEVLVDTMARQDLLSLLALQGHPEQESVKNLAREAMNTPAYRAAFEGENQRMGLDVSVRASGRAVDLELPLVTDARDAPYRADVERRSDDLRTLPKDSLSTAAEIGAAVSRAFQDSNRVQADEQVQASQGDRNDGWRHALETPGTFTSERAAGMRETVGRPEEPNGLSVGERELRFDEIATVALRRRLAQERTAAGAASDDSLGKTIQRMTKPELEAYGQAKGPTQAEEIVAAVRRRVEGEADLRPGRSSIPPLEDRFTVVAHLAGRRDYHFRDKPGYIAFSEGWMSMSTTSDAATVIKGMLDRADERGWATVRVNGTEEFKRQAWIAAEARGIRAVGYAPTAGDLQAADSQRADLQKLRPQPGGTVVREFGPRVGAGPEGQAREQLSVDVAPRSPAQAEQRHVAERGASTAQRPQTMDSTAVYRAFEAAMDAKRVPDGSRGELREIFRQELATRHAQGERFGVRIYDMAGDRPVPVPRADVQRAQVHEDQGRARKGPRHAH